MQSDPQDFGAFMKQREAAARAYVQGDPEPLGDLAAHSSPATFFAPFGGPISQGAEAVLETHRQGAKPFGPGSETHFEILHLGSSGDLGYWVGLQHAQVRMRGNDDPVPMRLRITELFRREDGGWKLIHRHAETQEVTRNSGE